LLAYLRDSMPRFDETFHPKAGSLTDDELKLWEPAKSPRLQKELRKLDLSGDLKRPIIIMHGTADAIVFLASPRVTPRKRGVPPPESPGGYPRELGRRSVN
jgi:hypothetical protein